MNTTEIGYTLGTCIAFMALVGVIAYLKTKGEVDSKDGYFLAGRGLTGTFIAGSLLRYPSTSVNVLTVEYPIGKGTGCD